MTTAVPFTRRAVLFLALAVAAFAFFRIPSALAASGPDDAPPKWPSSGVRLTIPAPQQSEADALFSLFKSAFAAEFRRTLIFSYLPDQAGADAWARMQDDPADGSVLTAVLIPNFMLRARQPDSGINVGSMTVCHVAAYTPCALWAANTSPVSSVRAFVDAAKSMGGNFLVAGPGRYSAGQIADRILNRAAGVFTTYIPYTSSIDAGRAVLARQAALFWAHSVMLPSLGGGVAPIAVASENRVSSMPGVPTFRELNHDVVQGVYYGIAVPADTPMETRQNISEFFSRHAGTPEFRARAEQLGFTPLNVPLEAVPAFLEERERDLERKIEEYDLLVQ